MGLPSFLPRPVYVLLFLLLGGVYVAGLFVPLMDNDSAHHANIALHMYLTGDYASLVDYGKDYLDKPHLHFWLAAFSYKLFGVTGFAYKLPSFLFTLLGIYSTYRLGKSLYDKETGKLAALLVASAFGFILANNDVRMDAILTACIAFSTWQLVDLLREKKIRYAAGAALGLALGFSTKGHIAVLVPGLSFLFYLWYKKEWSFLLNWKCWLIAPLFFLFISPVLYAYYLQYNLHPEKVVRGRDHINGVKFILLNQSVERFSGGMGSDAKYDYFFFFHSFLWAFAPWSVLTFVALFKRIGNFRSRREEWLTTGVLLSLALLVTFSGFKLPHYLNVLFPVAAVLTARHLLQQGTGSQTVTRVQGVVTILLLLFSLVLHAWAFPVRSVWVVLALVFLLALLIYFVKSGLYNNLQKAVSVSVSAMILSFFLLNTSFYPQLLRYQAGNELAYSTKGKVDPTRVFFWKDTYSSSYNFYTATLRREFTDPVLSEASHSWLLYDSSSEAAIRAAGYTLGEPIGAIDYEITKLDLKFVNPETRLSRCSRLVIARIVRTGE